MAQLELAHPGRLAALLVLPLLVFIAYRYAPVGARRQRTALLVCRLSLVTLLVVALAGPFYRGASRERYIVFAVDQSASLSEESRDAARRYVDPAVRGRRGGDKWATVMFTDDLAMSSSNESISINIDPIGSDPGAAVLAAAASIPAGYVADVVLLTDGRQTRGDLLSAAERAGVPVSVVPLPAFSEPEVAVGSVTAPSQARPGMPFTAQVTVLAGSENAGQVELYRNSERIAAQPLTAAAGENRVTFSAEIGSERAATFEARLVGFRDKYRDNNRATAVVYSAPPTKALLVDQDEQRSQRLATLLKQQSIEVSTLGTLPNTQADLQKYDVLVLNGVAPKTISAQQAKTLQAFVRDHGGGLIVVGQAATFGAEAYQASTLEQLLPVAALPKADERKTSLALTLIIDRSTSMVEENRLGLAKEAARQVVELLTPQDKVGVLAFGSDSQWISEIYPCSDKPELLRRIATLQAGGQTDIYPALVKAYLAMDQIDADRRHVILLTDANYSYPGDFQQIAARMAAAGVTMSTVSISKGAEQAILKDISRAAKGRHYHCDDPAEVPSILVRETKSVAAAAASEFRPLVFRQLPGLDISTALPLRDSVAVSPKTRSELLLIGASGDPLLSWWRYGDGVTVALAADVQQHWSSWPGYGKFWARLVGHAARDSTSREFTFELSGPAGVVGPVGRASQPVSDGLGRPSLATLEALAPNGTFLNGARAEMELKSPRTESQHVALTQVAPGRYQATFDTPELGAYEATVVLYDGNQPSRELFRASRSLVHSYPDELRVGPAAEALLRSVARVSGGTYDPPAEAVFAPTGRTVQRTTPLGFYLLVVAALILVADVAARRYHEWFGIRRAADGKQPTQGNHVGGVHEAA